MDFRIRLRGGALIIATVLAGCGNADEPVEEAAVATTSTAPTTTAIVSTTTTVAATATTTSTTTTTTEPPPLDGMTIYDQRCASCHGRDGTGGRGPSLVHHLATHANREVEFQQIVEGGDGMPAFGERLTTEEINEVIDYYTEAFGPAE